MSTVRLWDNEMRLLATQDECSEPRCGDDVEVTIEGDGPIHQAVLDTMPNLEANLYMTVDRDEGRIAATITTVKVTERRCECGNNITTTSICGQREC